VCVAPATADFLARVACGLADDLLTAVLLATRAPVVLCPAMNDLMYSHPQTRENLQRLRERPGYHIVEPAVGPLAFGEGLGPGRMQEPAVIFEHIGRALEADSPLRGRKVVVTAGPTREPVDAVRFLSNRSSGRMGFSLAAAAWRRGADVVLVSGPAAVAPPPGPQLRHVTTAAEMEAAVREELAGAAALIMAAAVADFRPARPAAGKIKKEHGLPSIELEPAPDVLQATRDARAPGLVTVGFALETEDVRENARRKLVAKGLDLVVLNDATVPGAGFEVETNQVVILDAAGGEERLPLMSKDDVAERIVDRVAALLGEQA